MTTWTGTPFTTFDNNGQWVWSDLYGADNMVQEIWKAMLGCGLTHVTTTYYGIDYDSIPQPDNSTANWPPINDNLITVTGPSVGMELADEFRNYFHNTSTLYYPFQTVFKFNDGLKEVYISCEEDWLQ